MESSAIRVAASAIRCPFCHDDVDPARDAWVACSTCLARHHDDCWRERAACASCQNASPLAAAAPKRIRITGSLGRRDRLDRRRRAKRRRWLLGGLVVASVVANILLLLIVVSEASASIFWETSIF